MWLISNQTGCHRTLRAYDFAVFRSTIELLHTPIKYRYAIKIDKYRKHWGGTLACTSNSRKKTSREVMNTQRRKQIFSVFISALNDVLTTHQTVHSLRFVSYERYVIKIWCDKKQKRKKARMLILDSDTSLWWSLWYCAHVSCDSKHADKKRSKKNAREERKLW